MKKLEASTRRSDAHEPTGAGMWAVVALKALTASLLWAALVLLVLARKEEPSDFFSHFLRGLFRGNPPGIAIQLISSKAAFLSQQMVTRLAIATAVYAAVESVEAAGLAMHKVWAEWLTIIVTVSFLPLEVLELTKQPTALKAATLVINIAVAAYLAKRMLDKRRSKPRSRSRRRFDVGARSAAAA